MKADAISLAGFFSIEYNVKFVLPSISKKL